MVLVCDDLLSENFNSISLSCDSIPIIQDNLENLASAICAMRCDVGKIATTSDCSLLPEDFFPTLFPTCDDIPDGAVVHQICGCNQGGLKVWVYDPDVADWVRIAKEFAIGITSDFVDPNNPTATELLALFDGHIADDALVLVRPTKEIWFSSNCGFTWQLFEDVLPFGADVEQTGFASHTQVGRSVVLTQWYDENIYTTGSSTTFAVAVNDLLDITIIYGYTIDQYSDAVNPQDDAAFRFRLSGCVADTSWYQGGASGNATIINGINYGCFNVKMRANSTGNLRLRMYFNANGSTPSGATDWIFTCYIDRTSVSCTRT